MQWSFFCPNSYQKVCDSHASLPIYLGLSENFLGAKRLQVENVGEAWGWHSVSKQHALWGPGFKHELLQWSRCKARAQNSELHSSIGLPWAAPDVKRTSTTENGLGLSNNVCYFSFWTTQPLARLYLDVSLILWLRMESWRLPRFPWFWYKTA